MFCRSFFFFPLSFSSLQRIEEANESRENLLDALNRSFTSEAGDETASDLMQSELAARDAEILSLTGQLHEKEKELQVGRYLLW